jgi:hypothetical protein
MQNKNADYANTQVLPSLTGSVTACCYDTVMPQLFSQPHRQWLKIRASKRSARRPKDLPAPYWSLASAAA